MEPRDGPGAGECQAPSSGEDHGAQPPAEQPPIDVIELNPHAPRPFVFTEVALCLRDMLRAAGFDAEHLVNQFDPEGLAIVFVPTDGWREAVARLDPARAVLFNMEQLGSASPWVGRGHVAALAGFTLADYHAANVELLRAAHGPALRVHEVPVVPSSSVVFAREPAVLAPSVDVLFYGTLNARRERVLDALRAAGLTLEVVTGAYAWELTPAIQRARLVLHVHYYETRLFPVARMLQPIASAVPIVCEASLCSPRNDWSASGIVFAEYDQLAATCCEMLAQPQRQLESARRNLAHARRVDTATPLRALLASLLAR